MSEFIGDTYQVIKQHNICNVLYDLSAKGLRGGLHLKKDRTREHNINYNIYIYRGIHIFHMAKLCV